MSKEGNMTAEELRAIRMQLIILMLEADPPLRERLKVYLK